MVCGVLHLELKDSLSCSLSRRPSTGRRPKKLASGQGMSSGEINAVAWLESVGCSRWEHKSHAASPAWRSTRQQATAAYVLVFQAAGLLHRRNPLSEVGHVLCRRTSLRLDETELSQKRKEQIRNTAVGTVRTTGAEAPLAVS